MVYLGALSGFAAGLDACGPPQVTDEGATPTPVSSNTPAPTPSPTGTPDSACGCNTTPGAGWSSLGIATSSIPVNALAYNGSLQLYVCHDSGGLYCMSSICTHNFLDMGSGAFTPNQLAQGFTCPHHGATFDGNGNPVNGIGSMALQHYGLTTDGSGNLYANTGMSVTSSCRC